MITEIKFRYLLRKRITVKKRRPAKGDNPDVPEGNDYGFNMIELVVAMAIIAALFGIGFAIYTNVIGDARGTALDANIQTASETLQLEGSIRPTILTATANASAGSTTGITAAMTERTNFVWVLEDGTGGPEWGQVPGGGNHAVDRVWVQLVETNSTARAASQTTSATTAPRVAWLPATGDAVRLLMRNAEGEWRCALIVFRTHTTGATAAQAAMLQGTWYDGGNAIVTDLNATAPTAPAEDQRLAQACSPHGTTAHPSAANTWNPETVRSLHRTPSAID